MLNMLAWVLPPSMLAWAVGAWFMYRLGGRSLEAQTLAFAAALAVMLGRVGVIKLVIAGARKGNPNANPAFAVSQAFVTAGLATIVILAALGSGMFFLLALPPTEFFLWLIGFYLIMLAAETWWLARVLKNFSPTVDKSTDAGRG
jgi:hypothetical protein